VIAWALSVASIVHCSFVVVEVNAAEDQYFGLFKFEDQTDDYCVRYDEVTFSVFNTAGKTARAFAVLAVLCSGFALALWTAIGLMVEVGVRAIWTTCIVLLSLAFLCQALTFLTLLIDICDDFDCSIGAAGIMSALCVFLFFVIAILMIFVKPPERPIFPISELKGYESAKLRYLPCLDM